MLLLSAGHHCLTLLTIPSPLSLISCPHTQPLLTAATLTPASHIPTSGPFHVLFSLPRRFSQVLLGSLPYSIQFSVQMSPLQGALPWYLFKTVTHLLACLQTHSLSLTLLFIAHISNLKLYFVYKHIFCCFLTAM